MAKTFDNFGVIGGGAWGTALAQTLAATGRGVTIWAYEAACVEAINRQNENTMFLPGVKLHASIKAASDIGRLGDCELKPSPRRPFGLILVMMYWARRSAERLKTCSRLSAVLCWARNLAARLMPRLLPEVLPK